MSRELARLESLLGYPLFERAQGRLRPNARALALTLRASGVNVNCLPVLDVRQPGATEIVGDRSLGDNPMQVAEPAE